MSDNGIFDENCNASTSYLRPISRQPIPHTAKRVFEGKLFDVYQWGQEQYDGTQKIFEKIKRPDTVYVLPVTSDGHLVICRQVQPGAQPFYGFLGGRVEDNEDIVVAARRELKEEAGLCVSTIKLWKSFQFLPKLEWAIYIFVGKGISFTSKCLDSGEKIDLVYVTIDELIELAGKESFGDVEVALSILRMSKDQTEYENFKKIITPTN